MSSANKHKLIKGERYHFYIKQVTSFVPKKDFDAIFIETINLEKCEKRIKIKDYEKNISVSFPISWIDSVLFKPYNITIFLDDEGEEIYKKISCQKNEIDIFNKVKKVDELPNIETFEIMNGPEQQPPPPPHKNIKYKIFKTQFLS